MKQNWKPLLILAVIIVAAFHLFPTLKFYGLDEAEKASMQRNSPREYRDLQASSINLGLDLQGGIHLVMEVDLTDLSGDEATDAVNRAQEVIRNRVDQFGVAEPTIQKQGANRIIVELPGLQDVERAKNLIGQTALLEFQLVEPNDERDRLLRRISTVLGTRSGDGDESEADDAAMPEGDEESGDTAEEEAPSLFDDIDAAGEDSTEAPAEEAVEAPAGERTLAAMLQSVGNELAVLRDDLQTVKMLLADPKATEMIPGDVEFLFTSKPEGDPRTPYHLLYLVRKKAEMTGSMVKTADVSIGQSVEYMGQPIVNFLNTDEGIRAFRRVTGAHVGERLAIVLDGAVYSAPVIQTKIMNGRSIITGSGTQEEANDLAIVLRAGALPAKVDIIEDRTVGPSLGRDSIDQGRTAALISMVLVALFMVAYYRLAGLIANVALALNIVFVLAVLAGFHATLTLPGIAGIILTIGMAVDANVLIFERIREELRTGKTVRAAIDSGYSNALSAIIDANLTTFIVGIVLYEFGTGPIRGFALTLCIGIVSSLFTALIGTRAIFDFITSRTQAQTFSIGSVSVLTDSRIQFLSLRRTAIIGSAFVLAAGLVSVVAINGLNPGIDFGGGTLLELHFDPPVEVEQLRTQLADVQSGDRSLDLSSSEIQHFGSPNDILIRLNESETGVADSIKATLRAGLASSIPDSLEWVRRQEKVGPKIGEELSGAAVRAVLVSLGLILVYMAWRFHQFLYGIAAVTALFHDVFITLGFLSILNIDITLAVVAGIMAIVGYSLNDTIVVFDRVRENLHGRSRPGGFVELLNVSINECLSRTVITSLTTLVAVIVLMVWGGGVIRDFTITLLIGILVGTYSSIFIASPVLYFGHERSQGQERGTS